MLFNPPYMNHFIVEIGQSFLHLIDTYFPEKHIPFKILNE